jgi:hypothetical protein
MTHFCTVGCRTLAAALLPAACLGFAQGTPSPPPTTPPLPPGPLALSDVEALLKQFNVPGVGITRTLTADSRDHLGKFMRRCRAS